MNVICLVGRLTADPVVRKTQDGTPVANFTLAVDRPNSGKGQDKQVDFIRCTCFGGKAEFMDNFMKKGFLTEVTGHLEINSYQDTQSNQRTSADVKCNTVINREPRKDGQQQSQPQGNNQQSNGNGYQQRNNNYQGQGRQNGYQNQNASKNNNQGGYQRNNNGYNNGYGNGNR